jgi:hypothetical protein
MFLESSQKHVNAHKNIRTFNGAPPFDGGAGLSKPAKSYIQKRKLVQNNDITEPPRTTTNGGYRSKILAPVMEKPPPTTNTFPVAKI